MTAGAAWAVPAITVGTAAPAHAGSFGIDGCAVPTWLGSVYYLTDPSVSLYWSFLLTFGYDLCSHGVTLDTVEVWTTYSSPAANSGVSLLVSSAAPGYVFSTQDDAFPVRFAQWDRPPVDQDGASLQPGYYDEAPCDRLRADRTQLQLTYTTAQGVAATARLDPPALCTVS